MSWALRGAKNTFEKALSALSTKLYYFPKKEHCKVAGVPAFAMCNVATLKKLTPFFREAASTTDCLL